MYLIDIHSHVYPEVIAEKAAESIRNFYELEGGGMDGTVDMLRKQGDLAGIDRFVILPVGLKPDRVRHINDFILEQVAAEPRFLGFGTVHAAMEQITEEVEYILSPIHLKKIFLRVFLNFCHDLINATYFCILLHSCYIFCLMRVNFFYVLN